MAEGIRNVTPYVPHDDAGHRLPQRAREKLVALQQQAADALAVTRAAQDVYADARDALRVEQRERNELQARKHASRPGATVENSPELAAAQRRVVARERELERSERLVDERQRQWSALASLVDNLESFTRSVPGTAAIVDIPVTAPALRKSETARQGVERIRLTLGQLTEERQRVENTSVPFEIAKGRLVAEIERLAQQGRPDVSGLLRRNSDGIRWASVTTEPAIVEVPGASPLVALARPSTSPDALALMVWTHKASMLAAMLKELEADARNAPEALSDAERAKRLAEIDGETLELERHEEVFISLAEAQGVSITRRPEASPAAVLGVEVGAEMKQQAA